MANTPSLLGSPYSTASSAPVGSEGAGPHLISCGETIVCASAVWAVAAEAALASTTIPISRLCDTIFIGEPPVLKLSRLTLAPASDGVQYGKTTWLHISGPVSPHPRMSESGQLRRCRDD